MGILDMIGIVLIVLVLLLLGYWLGRKAMDHEWKDKLPKIVEDRIKKSRAVLSGQFSEQLAPYLPDFPYKPTEAKFMGKPIDFIVFKGMDEKEITEVVFVEVKSGKAKINKHERILRDAIKEKRVSWEEYRIPEDLTK
ncbi:MAG: Holliday junction resolvase-like protein [Candidatus Hydrothermarchaeales archaeon]